MVVLEPDRAMGEVFHIGHKSGSSGVEAEANVICGPIAVGVAEDGFEESDCLGERGGAVGWVKTVQDTVAEGVEPGVHASGEWGGAGDEFNGLHGEASLFEETTVELG